MLLTFARWATGKIVLLYEQITNPVPTKRSAQAQVLIDKQTANLAIYEFLACPFCVKVRKVIRHKGLNIERRDAKRNIMWKEELSSQGGHYQVPCMKIIHSNGKIEWLYESDNIITWLEQKFPTN